MTLRRSRVRTLALLGVALSLATVAAQDAIDRSSIRRVVADLTAPGTDTGLLEDPLRPGDPAVALRRVTSAVGDPRYLPGGLIVKFRAGTSDAARAALTSMIGGTSAPPSSYANFDILSVDRAADAEALARRLNSQPDVEYAQPRYRFHPQFVPNDPLYARQWNYPAIDMERAWDINPGASSSIIVAVLDSGVAFHNEVVRFTTTNSLARMFFPNVNTVDLPFAAAPDLGGSDRFVAPRDFVWDDNDPVDLDGHGTHVSGTIGQLTNNGVGVAGMAFNVKIMPVKVIPGDWDIIFAGDVIGGTDDVVARGIRYAVDNGAKVLNMSIGRDGPPAPVIQDALTYAVSRGAFVAIAAGNEFLDGNPISRPADVAPQIDGVVAVGAIGKNLLRSRYSSTGSYVELAAPGGDQVRDGETGGILQQTYSDSFAFPARGAPRFDIFAYEYFQGTSMATPHVSGFAALLMQQGITSPAAIEAAMKRYATDAGAIGRDDEYGYGIINPRAALRGMGLAK